MTDRLLGLFEDLAQQAHAILEAATIFVAAVVVTAREEVRQHRDGVRGVEIDDVIANLLGAHRRLAVPTPEGSDVFLVHGPCLDRLVVDANPVRRRQRHLAAEAVGGVVAVVDQFDAGERAVGMHGFDQPFVDRQIALVP